MGAELWTPEPGARTGLGTDQLPRSPVQMAPVAPPHTPGAVRVREASRSMSWACRLGKVLPEGTRPRKDGPTEAGEWQPLPGHSAGEGGMNVGVEKLNSSQDERICDAAEPTGTHRTAMRHDTATGEHQGRDGPCSARTPPLSSRRDEHRPWRHPAQSCWATPPAPQGLRTPLSPLRRADCTQRGRGGQRRPNVGNAFTA